MTSNKGESKIEKNRIIAFISIALAIILAVAAFIIMIGEVGPVRMLEAEQIGDNIRITWKDADCSGYQVTVTETGKQNNTFKTKESKAVIDNISIGANYQIQVAKIKGKKLSRSAECSVETLEFKSITTVVDSCNGFAREKFNLKVQSDGDVQYASNNESVASVDADGEVYLHKVGEAVITVLSESSEDYARNVKFIPINVYPDKLGKISLDAEYTDGNSVKLSWNAVPHAQKYCLLRYNEENGKYAEYRTFKPDQTSIEFDRIDGKYKISAVSEVHGTTLKSQSAGNCKVESSFTAAKTYDSLHVVKTFDSSNLELLATIRGSNGASNPQSVCKVGDNYVVAFVNKGNSKGVLKAYNAQGELVKEEAASGMYHANGSTYNPKTNKIYVCTTYAGHNQRSLATFNGSSLLKEGNETLTRAPSGVAYDSSNNRYYMTASFRLYVMDEEFRIVKTIHRKRWKQSQDVEVYNGVAMSCIWRGGKQSYIDMYRIKDGAYIGSYSVPMGEIEGICMDNGYMIILINKGTDVLYITKDRISI